MNNYHKCPVCGFKGLSEPPYDDLGNSSFEICICCGFQFGVDDDEIDESDQLIDKEILYNLHKKKWIAEGSKPSSASFPKTLLNEDGSVKVSD